MKNWKVLIADDEEIIVEGLKVLYPWEKNGFLVAATAADGMEALVQAAEVKPDIVLMDINMPYMNGLETIEKMKVLIPNSYFIIISGYDDFSYAQKSLRLQISDYLLKPVSEDDLSKTIFHVRQQLEKHSENVVLSERTIDHILQYIDDNLHQNLSLNDLSSKFHMAPAYVSQYFKKQTQMNFLSYCNKRKIEQAQIMLIKTDKSITEISGSLGFSNYRIFSNVFKKYTGVLPSQYVRTS